MSGVLQAKTQDIWVERRVDPTLPRREDLFLQICPTTTTPGIASIFSTAKLWVSVLTLSLERSQGNVESKIISYLILYSVNLIEKIIQINQY